ncbi:MAG TPA: hypothetical protein V6D20_20165, partial [Candidatus Obscuribacterales bacterium]
ILETFNRYGGASRSDRPPIVYSHRSTATAFISLKHPTRTSLAPANVSAIAAKDSLRVEI